MFVKNFNVQSEGTTLLGMSVNVFVYGTLKTGEPNHYWLEEASSTYNATVERVGDGVTRDKLPLIIATEFNIPMLLGNRHDLPSFLTNILQTLLVLGE